MKQSYIVSYDLGTSGVKIALVDLGGNLISSETVGYSLLIPEPGWAEQDPDEFWDAVCKGTKQVVAKENIRPEAIAGIAFGTQWKGIIPLDGDDNVLHNAIIWLDGRAGKQAKKLNARMHKDCFTERDYWARLMWLKEELPEIYDKTASFLEVNAFLKFKTTGVKAVDLTNDFIHSLEPEIQDYYSRVLTSAELDLAKFPPLVMPEERVGELTAEAAQKLGLCEKTPVFGGCGDIPAVAIGAGCSSIGSAHIYLGSSGWLGISVPERKTDVGELYQTFDKNKELLLYVMQAAGMAQNWAVEQFYNAEKKLLKDDIFKYVNNDLSDIPPGSLNMIATPWLHGELPPLSNDARMVFFNINNMHDRRHMMNAVREGICFSLRWKIEMYREQTRKKLDSIRVVGGAALSDRWMQTIANILKIPVIIPENAHHAGAIGSAYCAIVGLGVCRDFDEADKLVKEGKIFHPDKAYAEMYDTMYGVFKNIYPFMKDMFRTLNKLH
ncbi:MAG: hypothetical protein JSW26_29980 [Desulfobacterales bacterium]|nr:MAG: hypothetical protein JSW26_29980 [Desulfobacterales bacterium]